MKKAISLILAVSAAFGLFACGGGGAGTSSEAPQSAEETLQSEESEPAPEPANKYTDGK